MGGPQIEREKKFLKHHFFAPQYATGEGKRGEGALCSIYWSKLILLNLLIKTNLCFFFSGKISTFIPLLPIEWFVSRMNLELGFELECASHCYLSTIFGSLWVWACICESFCTTVIHSSPVTFEVGIFFSEWRVFFCVCESDPVRRTSGPVGQGGGLRAPWDSLLLLLLHLARDARPTAAIALGQAHLQNTIIIRTPFSKAVRAASWRWWQFKSSAAEEKNLEMHCWL